MVDTDTVEDGTYRIRIWHGRYKDYPEEPDEVITVEAGGCHLWKDDPYFDSGPVGFDIHPKDAPATLNIYTSDSVRPSDPRYSGDGYVDESYWNGPVEHGLTYPPDHDYPPFGCEVWARVLFHVEPEDNIRERDTEADPGGDGR